MVFLFLGLGPGGHRRCLRRPPTRRRRRLGRSRTGRRRPTAAVGRGAAAHRLKRRLLRAVRGWAAGDLGRSGSALAGDGGVKVPEPRL